MRRFYHYISIIILMLCSIITFAQEICQWALSGSASSNDINTSIKQDHSGNVYYTTYTDSAGETIRTALRKINLNLQLQWEITFTGNKTITDIEIDAFDNIVATGLYEDSIIAGNDTIVSPGPYYSSFIFKADPSSQILWIKDVNPRPSEFKTSDLFIGPNGFFYLTADIQDTGIGNCSFHKLDQSGNLLQSEFADMFGGRTFSHILADSSGNVYVSGTCGINTRFDTIVATSEQYQNVLLKYNPLFNAQWLISRPYITFDNNNGLGSDGQNLYWAILEKYGNFDSTRLIKTDYSGNILLDEPGPLQNAFFPALTSSTNSKGNTTLAVNVFNTVFLFEYDAQFNLAWQDTIQAHISGFPPPVQVMSYDSCFYLASRYGGDSVLVDTFVVRNPDTAGFTYDILLAKYKHDLTLSATENVSNEFARIFPVPANQYLTIEKETSGETGVIIYDLSGRIIYSRNHPGKTIHLDTKNLIPGCYLLTLSGKDKHFAKKFFIAR